MSADDRRDGAGDEGRILEELERLHAQIQAARRRRAEANDEFDSFLRSINRGAAEPPPHAAKTPRPAAAVRARPRGADGVPSASHAVPSGEREPAVLAPPAPPSALAGEEAGAERRRVTGGRVVALLVVATIGVVTWSFFAPVGPPPVAPSGQSEREAAPPAGTEPARPAPSLPAAAPPSVPVAEVTTVRPVWLRILVDGERALEREVEGNARIPLAPRETLVVRAGDGAAVRVAIRGADQGPLGRPGVPVTRAFTIPPASTGAR